ncbi:MAG: hypothetical protein Q8N17_16045, partial [Burkholderiaceae bacterium]|nr:hypothetical protein [Burkholderiaceae bacterium]
NPFKVQGSKLKPGTRSPEHTAVAWVLGIVWALMPAGALAQAMSDPTRPPTGYAEADAGTAASGLVLQSVMISPTLKAVIINGEMVKLGGKFGSARLVKITESEVVLKDGEESQVLKLYPGVEKRAVEKPEAKTAAKRRK